MLRYLAVLSIITTTIMSSNITTVKSDDIRYKGNALRVFSDFNTSCSKEDKFDNFWTSQNEEYLSETQKEKLNFFREKVNNNIQLSITECKELKIMKSEVIKKKLGEEKFKELEKLINKREENVDLTLPERQRLYELNKEARD